eukprot:3593987-Rhodomonas_salina.1
MPDYIAVSHNIALGAAHFVVPHAHQAGSVTSKPLRNYPTSEPIRNYPAPNLTSKTLRNTAHTRQGLGSGVQGLGSRVQRGVQGDARDAGCLFRGSGFRAVSRALLLL